MSKERKNNPLYLDFVTFHCYRIADNDYQRVACVEKLALAGELTKSGMSYGRYPITIRDGSANDICGDLGAALDVSVSPSRRLGFCCPDNSALLIGQQNFFSHRVIILMHFLYVINIIYNFVHNY